MRMDAYTKMQAICRAVIVLSDTDLPVTATYVAHVIRRSPNGHLRAMLKQMCGIGLLDERIEPYHGGQERLVYSITSRGVSFSKATDWPY